MTTPPNRPDDLPEWASAGNYSAPGRAWDGQPRLNDAAAAAFAANGLIPAVPSPAPAFNSWLRRVWEWISLGESDFGIGTDLYGGTQDGNVTISSDTTLTADLHADTLTVNATFTLNTAGFRVFARRIVNNGSIGETAPDGADADAGGPGAGAFRAAATLGATGRGGDGGASGDPGDAASAVTFALGGAGGAGGTGDTATNAGGTAGAPTYVTPAEGRAGTTGYAGHVLMALSGRTLGGNQLRGGLGGGGGGGGGGLGISGGAGGGGGPVVLICAREIVNNGTIFARGGDGGDAFGGTSGGGGGGGGGGGAVILITRTPITGSGTIDVSGGEGGEATGSSVDGVDGSDGVVYQFTL